MVFMRKENSNPTLELKFLITVTPEQAPSSACQASVYSSVKWNGRQLPAWQPVISLFLFSSFFFKVSPFFLLNYLLGS